MYFSDTVANKGFRLITHQTSEEAGTTLLMIRLIHAPGWQHGLKRNDRRCRDDFDQHQDRLSQRHVTAKTLSKQDPIEAGTMQICQSWSIRQLLPMWRISYNRHSQTHRKSSTSDDEAVCRRRSQMCSERHACISRISY